MNRWLWLVLFFGSVATGVVYLKWFSGDKAKSDPTTSPAATIEPATDGGNGPLSRTGGLPQKEMPVPPIQQQQPLPQQVPPPQYTPPPNNYYDNNNNNYEPPPPPQNYPENQELYNPPPFDPGNPDNDFNAIPPPPPPPPPPPEEDFQQ